jgi:phage-related protein
MRMTNESPSLKPVVWIGSSKTDSLHFPEEVKDLVGFALYVAQRGAKHPDAKPLAGFGSAGVLEVIADHRGDTFRTVYTVRLAGCIYVLHAFQKKSKSGIATPKSAIDLIKARLKRAEQEQAQSLKRGKLDGSE